MLSQGLFGSDFHGELFLKRKDKQIFCETLSGAVKKCLYLYDYNEIT